MDESDRLRLEYERATSRLRELTEIRFKLLALAPTLAGAAVAFVGKGGAKPSELLAIGVLGFAATVGILVYELRNSQIRDHVARRVRAIEDREFPRGRLVPAGERPVRLFGLRVWHGRGVALVYSAALAGWFYLVAWGALAAVDVGRARGIGIVLGAAAGIALLLEVERLERGLEQPLAAAEPSVGATGGGSRGA